MNARPEFLTLSRTHDLISRSLERLSELHGDPTAAVYERLFAQSPELERLFLLDRQGMVRGSMLASVFDVLLDMAGPRRFGLNLVAAERANHEEMGVPPAAYASFFAVVLSTTRDLLGREWTPETEAAWRHVLDEIEASLNPPPA